ncbi:MAG TPA: hypothetical protein PLT18_01240, partial [Gemmiger qucibialis]|nr:hypothetical protein [Gemmiger qucibialis]
LLTPEAMERADTRVLSSLAVLQERTNRLEQAQVALDRIKAHPDRDTRAVRVDALDGKISWQHIENAQGCNVRYGIAPDKLYQSWLVYDADEVTLSTLMSGQTYYVCVDSFNENGITTGKIIKMEG